MSRRAPIDAHGGRATSATDLQIACRIIERSGVVPTGCSTGCVPSSMPAMSSTA